MTLFSSVLTNQVSFKNHSFGNPDDMTYTFSKDPYVFPINDSSGSGHTFRQMILLSFVFLNFGWVQTDFLSTIFDPSPKLTAIEVDSSVN